MITDLRLVQVSPVSLVVDEINRYRSSSLFDDRIYWR